MLGVGIRNYLASLMMTDLGWWWVSACAFHTSEPWAIAPLCPCFSCMMHRRVRPAAPTHTEARIERFRRQLALVVPAETRGAPNAFSSSVRCFDQGIRGPTKTYEQVAP